MKPQARRGAGLAEQPALPEGRTAPLLLRPPTASFRLSLLCPRRTRTPPNRAACLLRSGGRGDGGWELPPPGSLRPRGRAFPPIPRVFLPPPPSPCQVFFICFIPAPREGRAEGGAGSPREPPGERPCGQGRAPAPLPRGAETGGARLRGRGGDGSGGSGPGQVSCPFARQTSQMGEQPGWGGTAWVVYDFRGGSGISR